jgi:hypothetical protein
MSVELIPRIFALVVCVVSIFVLGILVILIWAGAAQMRISHNQFLSVRKGLALFAVVYAILCAWRLIANVALPRELPQEFVPELIAISIFGVLVPPIWFFVEYFAVASDRITNLPANQAAAADQAAAANETAKAKYLKTIKDYADYASKIWAGVLALLLDPCAPRSPHRLDRPQARPSGSRWG